MWLNITVLDQKSSFTVIKDINLSHLHKKLLSLAEPAERGISIFSNQKLCVLSDLERGRCENAFGCLSAVGLSTAVLIYFTITQQGAKEDAPTISISQPR